MDREIYMMYTVITSKFIRNINETATLIYLLISTNTTAILINLVILRNLTVTLKCLVQQ